MKRFFTPLFILSALTSFSQITITQSDLPVVGNYLISLTDTVKGAHSITAAGASAQVWNYTAGWTLYDTTTVYFQTRTAVPGNSYFAGATMGSYDATSNTSTFYKNISTGFWGDGFYDPSQAAPYNVIDANPDLLLVPTPFTYGNSKTNNAKVVIDVAGSPSYRYKVTLKQTITSDAWGTISTPSVSNASVIREKTFMYEIDSIYVNFGFGYLLASVDGPKDTTITYSFLRKGPNMTVMTIDQDWQSLQETQASYYVYAPILPVTLLNFNAQCSGTGVQLNWSTATESNSAFFIAERSTDGQHFTPQLTKPAAGNSNVVRNYKAFDINPGNAFYRLKMTDRDGKFSYSNVVAVNCALKSIITISPNPANDVINLSFSVSTASKATMSMFSASGAIIKNLAVPISAGSNKLTYDISKLSSGTYYILLKTSEGQLMTDSFIKL
jgi:hypothetical protein